jgi:predicted dehydrogenase
VADAIAAADAVIVAAPTRFHATLGRQVLEAGRHLFMEKPIAATLEEAEALAAIAAARGRVLQVGHIERFSAAFRAVLAAPGRDAALSWEAVRAAPFRPRSLDVSVVLDLMIHDIDLVLALAGEEAGGGGGGGRARDVGPPRFRGGAAALPLRPGGGDHRVARLHRDGAAAEGVRAGRGDGGGLPRPEPGGAAARRGGADGEHAGPRHRPCELDRP